MANHSGFFADHRHHPLTENQKCICPLPCGNVSEGERVRALRSKGGGIGLTRLAFVGSVPLGDPGDERAGDLTTGEPSGVRLVSRWPPSGESRFIDKSSGLS